MISFIEEKNLQIKISTRCILSLFSFFLRQRLTLGQGDLELNSVAQASPKLKAILSSRFFSCWSYRCEPLPTAAPPLIFLLNSVTSKPQETPSSKPRLAFWLEKSALLNWALPCFLKLLSKSLLKLEKRVS